VTQDRNLARRVAAEMARWNVAIDDSAGRPLAHTAAGTFLCLLAEAAQARFAPVPLLALLKHPFARGGQDSATFRARARELDRWCLRGPRPDPGLAGITRAIAKAGEERAPPEGLAQLAAWWDGIAKILAPLEHVITQPDALLESLLDAQLAAAEALACDESSTCILWAAEDGEAAFALTAELKLAAQSLDPIETGSWPALFRSLAMQVPVRAQRGQHPRLAILGPLEARLQRFDLIILGGLNEGSWPQGAQSDPWFSRPMRASLGLDQPERGIGLSAHDFAMLAAGPRVLLTRALKAEGVPTIASRWLQRLEQLTRGLQLHQALTPELDYARLAGRLMDVPQGPRLPRPAPTPPVETRPKKLSVTEIETWLRDPYAIYAKHVLGLKPLDAIDEPIGPLERGTALHRALEIFIAQYKDGLPDDAAARLTAIADQVFEQAGIPKAALALWRPRFAAAARGFVESEQERRGAIKDSHLEIRGKLALGDFTLTGIADRIDILKDGKAAILDYKTGATPTQKQVTQLLSPQLPLEGAMLAVDGFDIGAHVAEQLIYLSLASEKKARDPRQIEGAVELAQEAVAQLTRRIAWFKEAATPYRPRVRPYRTDIPGDFDHLARVREWSPSGWSEES
jgi:ATP-dependent helicase/nuclease subunit B